MQYTENYNLYKPVYGEPADVADLNHNADEIDGLIHDNRTMIAPAYDTAVSYAVGDIVEHLGKVYKCTGATTGVWDATKWTQTTLADEIEEGAGGASALADLDDVEITNPSTGQALLFDDGDDVWKNQNLPDVSVTKNATGNPIEITDAADAPLVKCVTQITGSQDLHGYDKPWVGGSGKNKYNYETRVDNYYIRNDGEIRAATGSCYSALIPASGTVTLSGHTTDGGIKRIIEYDANGDFLRLGNYVEAAANTDYSVSATVGENTVAVRISLLMTDTNVQLELGSTATAYSPYSNICPITGMDEVEITVADAETDPTVENTYTIDLNGTRYGGTVDAVRGVLRVTHIGLELDGSVDERWTFYNTSSASAYAMECGLDTTDIDPDYLLISNSLESVSPYTTWGNYDNFVSFNIEKRIIAGMKTITTVSDWKTYLSNNPLQVVYKLTTPIEIPLTPTAIRTLSGNNYIWTDADSMNIKYITKPYEPVIEATDISIKEHGRTIESIITENLEPRMVASRNYTIGELIISGDKAYRATANIASGATLTVGTNVVSTTIEEEIGRSGHVYSTAEQVVGTWIDGSTLYAKSYHMSTVTSTYVTVDSTITCINAKIRNCSMGTITVGGAYNDAQYVDGRMSQSQFARVILSTGGLTVGMENPPSDPITDFDFTIQYTKSSS